MASAIDPTLGGDLDNVVKVRKAQMSTALTAARDEISALQAGGTYDLNGGVLTIDALGDCTLYQSAVNQVRFTIDGVDKLEIGVDRLIFMGGLDLDLDENYIRAYHIYKYNNLSGAQTLNRANFESGATLVHSGGAASYTVPSRNSTVTTESEQLMIRNRGTGAISLVASGVTIKGNTTIAQDESAALEWEYSGTTQYVWVNGGS